MFKGKLKKSIITVLALLMLISSTPSFAATTRFKDVPTTYWGYTYIEDMAKLGYLNGYPKDNTFRPENNINFLEIMSILSKFVNPTATEKTNASYAYSTLLNELKIVDWAKEGLAICLYNDIITESELRSVSQKKLVDKPINRVDTSEFLAKGMGLEETAKNKIAFALPYKDVLSIEARQMKYLSVLIDAKVLTPEGKGNYLFEPKANIKRSEITKMLSTAYDYLQKNPTPSTPTTPEPPKPAETDTLDSIVLRISELGLQRFLVVEDARGGEEAYIIMSNTSITVDGKSTTYLGLVAGQEVELTLKKNTREIISIKSKSVEEDIEGKIKSLNSTTSKMTVEYTENKKTVTKDYIVDKNADIYLDDKSVNLKDLREGDLVVLKIKNNSIYDIEAKSKNRKVEGIITELTLVKDSKDKEYNITIVDSKNNSHKFLINSKTYLYRNNKRIDSAEELKIKDEAYIEAEYDVAIEVDASVVKKNIKGLIVGMNTRLHQNTDVVIFNQETKKEETYTLGKTVYIRVDKIVTNSLDLKTGYYVEVVVEGDEITEIDADSRGLEATIMGKISYIHPRTGDITLIIDYFDLDGSKYGDEITIHVKADIIIADRNLKPVSFSYLQKGDRINVIGSYDGSSFIANTIQIR